MPERSAESGPAVNDPIGPRPRADEAVDRWPRPIVPVMMLALFWGCILVFRLIELPAFTQFMSRVAVGAAWTLAFLVWWLTRRRIRWSDRLLPLAAAIAFAFVAAGLKHRGLGWFFLVMLGVPSVLTFWSLWLAVGNRAAPTTRRFGLLAALLLAWLPFTVIRMSGLTGDGGLDAHWRWTPQPEDVYLAQRASHAAPQALSSTTQNAGGLATSFSTMDPAAADWPGFRGPDRDGIVHGARVRTDWSERPPRTLWRQRIGPAWSSMVIIGNRLFTQEQRGDLEAIVCLDASTGAEIWACTDPVRHDDPQGGVGPRATPTFWHGRVYAFGATGLLSCLDAGTGSRIWRRDVSADASVQRPIWGFASSPLLTGGLVVMYAGGDHDKGMLAYQADTGAPAWSVAAGRNSYASPQLARLDGVDQVLMFSDAGLLSVAPANGAVLWNYESAENAPRSVQPHAVDGHRVLFAAGLDLATSALDVARTDGQWKAARAWQSRSLKPSFNDFVIESGNAYGFDGGLMACIDVATGAKRWKQGRYGRGQLLLLAEQRLLLIVGDSGEVALVAADPSGFKELGRFQAIEGKTWNDPAIAGDRLFVRNAEEIACFVLDDAVQITAR